MHKKIEYQINRYISQIETNANLDNRTLWFALINQWLKTCYNRVE